MLGCFSGGVSGKELDCQFRRQKRLSSSPGLGRSPRAEKGMASHSSTLVWRIPWVEKSGGLQSTGSRESVTTERLNNDKEPGSREPCKGSTSPGRLSNRLAWLQRL